MSRRLLTALVGSRRKIKLATRAPSNGLLPRTKGHISDAEKARTVASFWDTNVGRHREPFAHWESPAPIQHALNKLVTGEISVQPPRWFMHQYGPFKHVAELGCGDGIVVRFLLDIDPGLKVDSYDISPASLARAADRIKVRRESGPELQLFADRPQQVGFAGGGLRRGPDDGDDASCRTPGLLLPERSRARYGLAATFGSTTIRDQTASNGQTPKCGLLTSFLHLCPRLGVSAIKSFAVMHGHSLPLTPLKPWLPSTLRWR